MKKILKKLNSKRMNINKDITDLFKIVLIPFACVIAWFCASTVLDHRLVNIGLGVILLWLGVLMFRGSLDD